MKSWKLPLIGIFLVGITSLIAGILVFQDNLTRAYVKPTKPYQIYTPPPPPAYGARGAWALWPDDPNWGAADVFYIHSTTYQKSRHWNGPFIDREADLNLKEGAAPNEAGPFAKIGPIYGPRYRQATLFATFTFKYDGLAARALAFKDVEAAFEHFVQQTNSTRPIVLVGYEQGGLYALGLLQRYFAKNDELKARLAAAYIIGAPVPADVFKADLREIPPCASPYDSRCLISYIDLEPRFDEEMRRLRPRALIWGEGDLPIETRIDAPLCINPLNWTPTPEYMGPDAHIGAASSTGLEVNEMPPPISKAIGAKCTKGILIVDRPKQAFLRRGDWFGAKWGAQDFNLFYHDLAADAERRVNLVTAILKEEARHLDPIEEALELGDSPINKVPDP